MAEALLLVGDSESNQNLYYTTRFLAGDPFVYLEGDGRHLLVVSPMERGRAEKESTVREVKTFDDYGYRDLVREHGDSGGAFSAIGTRGSIRRTPLVWDLRAYALPINRGEAARKDSGLPMEEFEFLRMRRA